jgi:hypothetical protein
VFPVIVKYSHITYRIHASYTFYKRTKTHIILMAILPLSGDSNIFVHLAAAPGRRLVSARSSNSTKLLFFFSSNFIVTSRYRLIYNFIL